MLPLQLVLILIIFIKKTNFNHIFPTVLKAKINNKINNLINHISLKNKQQEIIINKSNTNLNFSRINSNKIN
jgi:hypothetical protein